MYSEELFNESKKYFPGGVNSPVRAFKPCPFFVKSAGGSKLTDEDGKTYIDHCLAYGPLILGHSNPKVVREVSNQLTMGRDQRHQGNRQQDAGKGDAPVQKQAGAIERLGRGPGR